MIDVARVGLPLETALRGKLIGERTLAPRHTGEETRCGPAAWMQQLRAARTDLSPSTYSRGSGTVARHVRNVVTSEWNHTISSGTHPASIVCPRWTVSAQDVSWILIQDWRPASQWAGTPALSEVGMASHPSSEDPPVDPVAASVAAYSDHAEDYETTYAERYLDRVERFSNALPARSRILDAGCGPGRDLARFTARGHLARGVELNPLFAAMADARAPTSLRDLRELEDQFPDEAFDGIWSCASLVHLLESEAVAVLGQFARLLSPGGRLYASVKASGRTGWHDEPDGRRWYTVWDADTFARTVTGTGFTIEEIVRGPFVEVWASRSRRTPR